MKGLTLTQPWASLVALGAKTIETRSWSTSYRGPVAIHAAKGLGSVGGPRGLLELCGTEPFHEALRPLYIATPGRLELPLGAIVATAALVDVVPTGRMQFALNVVGLDLPERVDRERAFGDYSPGRFAWLLDGVRALERPVECAGMLGLWTVPAEIEAVL